MDTTGCQGVCHRLWSHGHFRVVILALFTIHRLKKCLGGVAVLLAISGAAMAAEQRVIRVAADPNNLPFSNRNEEGFENKIARLVAKELDAKLEYIWLSQRMGFIRETVGKNGNADLIISAPDGFDKTLTTRPYYRSTYVFVQRPGFGVRSFDDPKLRSARIGVQAVMAMNTPPLEALARRGMVTNLVGFPVPSGEDGDSPERKMVQEVAAGKLDVAVLWGPWAGYYARRERAHLEVTPVTPEQEGPLIRFAFDMCMGVRKSEPELRDELNEVIQRKRSDLEAILKEYAVPTANRPIAATQTGGR